MESVTPLTEKFEELQVKQTTNPESGELPKTETDNSTTVNGQDVHTNGVHADKQNDVNNPDTESEGVKQTSSVKPNAWPNIKREDVKLPQNFRGRLAFVLYNVLSKEECEDYIKRTEKMGYEEALVNVGGGRQRSIPEARNNTRCIWDSVEEADRLWQRIKQHVPTIWKGHKVLGLNERLRFLKYNPGEYFKPHMDGQYRRDTGERSFVTIQLYLNEGFKGGSTTFMNYNEKEQHEVVPKTGMVLVFQHDIMHEGSVLREGRKYAVRTDVMYSAENGYK